MKIPAILFAVPLMLLAAAGCSDQLDYPKQGVYPSGSGEEEKAPYRTVKAQSNSTSSWYEYTAKTVDRIPSYTMTQDPPTGTYGGYKVGQYPATGFFYTKKINNRWWIIDPEGYPFIHKGVAVVNPGSSARQQAAKTEKFGTNAQWAEAATALIKSYGFNGAGAWSNHSELKKIESPLVYTIILNPVSSLNTQVKQDYGYTTNIGWQGYYYDVPPVFDPRLEQYMHNSLRTAQDYASDPNLLGYFIDNELPWPHLSRGGNKGPMLTNCLTRFPADHYNTVAAKAWLAARRGNSSTDNLTESEQKAFVAYAFEKFISTARNVLRQYDPNHMLLGTKFNQENEELVNADLLAVAGQYTDVITIDHYRKWEPSATEMAFWGNASGIPFLIAEFYTKGMDAVNTDTQLTNASGAGWNVETQADRGYFYQNFVIELIKSRNCVGWHWFTYQDNDPTGTADESNTNSNKGIVSWNFTAYTPLLDQMKAVNDNVFQLTLFYDK